MRERKFPLTIERFGHGAGKRADHAQTVVGKVRAVSRVDTDQGVHLLKDIRKAPLG